MNKKNIALISLVSLIIIAILVVLYFSILNTPNNDSGILPTDQVNETDTNTTITNLFADVDKLTLIEVNSTDPDCVECRSTHSLITEQLPAIGNNVAYKFIITPHPTAFSPEDQAVVESFYSNDFLGYCLQTKPQIADKQIIDQYIKLSYDSSSPTDILSQLSLSNDASQQIANCVTELNGDLSLASNYFEQLQSFNALETPVVMIQKTSMQPVIVSRETENIQNLLEAIKSNPQMVIDNLE